MRYYIALLAILITVTHANQCVPTFDSNRGDFNNCLTSECFVFRTEIPYVFLGSGMNSSEHERPFPCSQRKQEWPGLQGPFFDIIENIPSLSNAYCVWGGPTCVFDDMVEFVRRTSKNESKHKFIAGGMLFMLEYRMSEFSIPSAPLMEDKLLIIGPRSSDRATWANAWRAMWRPFTTKAWVLLFLAVLFMLFLRLWIAWFFTHPFDWHRFRDTLIGDYEPVDPTRRRVTTHSVPWRTDQTEVRRLNSYLANGAKLFFVITVLYYEISVVDFVFEERREEVTNINPRSFAITQKSTMDFVFTQHYNQTTSASNCRVPCWKRVADINTVFSVVTNRSDANPYRFSAVYESFNRYHFKENVSLCQTLQVLDYKSLNRRFAGVWYYSPNIPLNRRMAVDRAIVRLRESGKIADLIHMKTGESLPSKCEISNSVSMLLLGLPIFMFPGPIFAFVTFYMILHCLRRYQFVGNQAINNQNRSPNAGDSDDVLIQTDLTDSMGSSEVHPWHQDQLWKSRLKCQISNVTALALPSRSAHMPTPPPPTPPTPPLPPPFPPSPPAPQN